MLRRWCLSLISAGVVAVPATVACAAAAQAAPRAGAGVRPAVPPLVRLIRPGVRLIRPGGLAQHLLTRGTTSGNWSGYAAAGHAFRKVSANWVEPAVRCSGIGSTYSSFWVGLDGLRSSTVEQTGSEADCSTGQPKYYSWYEMYPANPVNFGNRVRAGDHFSASVTYDGSGHFTLVLTDHTRGWRHTVRATLAGTARNSAEVIAEAPSSSLGVLPLADFRTVGFRSSMVNGHPIGSYHPSRIVMVNGSNQPKDKVSRLSYGRNFSVTWLSST